MQHTVTLLMSEFVTHDVKRFIASKPAGFTYEPGQGVELVINQPRWREEDGRPFTPTSHPDDQVLEFTIKRYADHHGVTDKLHTLKAGDELLISEPFGTIGYHGGGVFIAAGAGITPFLAIFRTVVRRGLLSGQQLLFANKTTADIICEKELRYCFNNKAIFTLTRERRSPYRHGRIDGAFIRETVDEFTQHFYVCGPEQFVTDINAALRGLGVNAELLVFEQ